MGIVKVKIKGEEILGYYKDYRKVKLLTRMEKEEIERINNLISISGGSDNEHE